MENGSVSIPSYFLCPISLEVMEEPVIVSSGMTYDRKNIEKWMNDGHSSCPITRQEIKREEIIANHILDRLIQAWLRRHSKEKQCLRVCHVRFILSQYLFDFNHLSFMSSKHQMNAALQGLQKLKSLASKSQFNQMVIRRAEAIQAIAALLAVGSSESRRPSSDLLEIYQEAISLLVLLDVGDNILGSRHLVNILWIMYVGTTSSKLAAAALLQRVDLGDKNPAPILLQNALKSMVQILEEGATPDECCNVLKALGVVSSSWANKRKVVSTGVMGILIKKLSEGSTGNTEAILGLINSLCDCAEGREVIRMDKSSVAVIMANIPSQSDVGTKHAISTMISVCKHYTSRQISKFMLENGIIEKVLFIMQMGSSNMIKRKAMSLLSLCS